MTTNQGWINIYKPKNISSFQVIKRIKKKYLIKKIGHAGTLDPLAEGVLPIALGKATKLIPFINLDLKCYIFTVYWGSQTTTDDSEGEILFKSNIKPKIQDIKNLLQNFKGNIYQTPPKVSAVKIKGERAYKLARQKKDFEILPKKVFVNSLEVVKHDNLKTVFKIQCGKGFYVRSFARDLGIKLKTYGHISSLERTKVGKFDKKSSILLDDLLKIGHVHPEFKFIQNSISMLDDILAYEIERELDLIRLSNGRSITLDLSNMKFDQKFFDNKYIFLSKRGNVISFGKLVGNLFKPKKILI